MEEKNPKTADLIIFATFVSFLYNLIFKVKKIYPAKMKIGERKQLMSGDVVKAAEGVNFKIYDDIHGVRWIERVG